MKKYLLIISLICTPTGVFATHTFDYDATNIRTGTVDPQRLPFNNGATSIDVDSATVNQIVFPDGQIQTTVGISSGSQTVNSYHLKNTGVSAGTYGGGLLYPQITVDEDGRLTNVSIQNYQTPLVIGYDVIIGTLTDSAATISSNTVDGLNAALTLLGANGMTTSKSAGGNILLKRGVYTWTGATIPAGVTLYAEPGSSVTITPAHLSTGTIITNYGKVENINFDFQNKHFSGDQFVAKTNSIAKNLYFYGAKNGNDLAPFVSMFAIKQSSNVTVDAKFDQLHDWPIGLNKNSAPFIIQGSSQCYIKTVIGGEWDSLDAVSKGVFFYYSNNSRGIFQKDFVWNTPGTRIVFVETGTGLSFESGVINISSNTDPTQGLFDFYPTAMPTNAVSISSCIVKNVNFFINGPYSGSLIGIAGQGSNVNVIEGTLLQNNFAYCTTGNCSMSFYSIQNLENQISQNTLIIGNILRGVSLGTDNGVNTIKSGNYRDSTSF